MKIRKSDPSAMSTSRTAAARPLSPRAQARLEQTELINKQVLSKLNGPEDVYEVRLEAGEKPATIRQRLLRAAADRKMEIAIRIRGESLFVGLMTPERRSRRGRKPKSAA